MANLTPSPIGGQFISSFGGLLGFLPFQGVLRPAGIYPSAGVGSGVQLLDSINWQLETISGEDDTTHTGSFGSNGLDVPFKFSYYSADIVWDVRNPPNWVSQNGGNLIVNPNFNAGVQVWFFIGNAANYPTDNSPNYWYCPSIKSMKMTTIVQSKKMVRARIEGKTNAPVFAFGAGASEIVLYNQYISHCNTRNWVW